MLKNSLYCEVGKYWILERTYLIINHFWVRLSSNESDISLKNNELNHVKAVISIFRALMLTGQILTVGWNALCLVNKSKLIQQVLIVDYGKWYLLWKLIIYRKKVEPVWLTAPVQLLVNKGQKGGNTMQKEKQIFQIMENCDRLINVNRIIDQNQSGATLCWREACILNFILFLL